MTQVWGLKIPHNQQWVLLAMADIADDDGTRCYPSMDYLAWKTTYSESQVRRIVGELRDSDLIVAVAYEKGGRGRATHYHLHLENGIPKAPFVPKRDRVRDTEETDLDDEENLSADANLSHESSGAKPSNVKPFAEPGETKPSHPDTETLSSETETLAPAHVKPSIRVRPDPLGSIKEPLEEPLVVPDALPAPSGDDSEPLKFEPPDYWRPLLPLEGYANRNYSKFVKVLEKTCGAQGVDVAEVVGAFAEYYVGNRFRHGWSDPVVALRRTLAIQISKMLKTGPQQTPHQKRIAAEKALPAPRFEIR